MKVNTRRSGFSIMKSLIVLVKPLTFVMILGILLGVLGFLCAIFLTITGGYGIIKGLYTTGNISIPGNIVILDSLFSGNLFASLILMAVARGILHYGEQYCNHYIAFRILVIIRYKVFGVLRKLCPAKLEGKEKGNLIAIITGDIELLEVFFAHTISPIAIAFITLLIMVIFIGMQHPLAGLISLFGYLSVGIALPLWNGSRSADAGMNFRNNVGELNNFVINSMYGVDEILQYNQGKVRLNEMNERSLKLSDTQKKLSICEGSQRSATNLFIQLFSWVMFFSMLVLYRAESISFPQMLIATLAMKSSFGPTVALSSLSNNLNQTLACGERVLSLLEEEPAVNEVSGEESTQFNGAKLEQVNFSYGGERILDNVSLDIKKGQVLGIHGVSGSGKSTLLKLLMRFWDVNTGKIFISKKNIKNINTDNLREMTGYVIQYTIMFSGSITDNIRVAKQNATMEEIQNAARKASIHNFITSLPKGYETFHKLF